MQNAPVCRLRNQFLPLGYEAFCHLSSYFMFPKRIHSLPHSSFLRENQIQVKTRTLIALSSIMQAQIYLFDSSTEGKANEMLEFILSSYILCVWAAVWTWLSQLFNHIFASLSETCWGCSDSWQKLHLTGKKKTDCERRFFVPSKAQILPHSSTHSARTTNIILHCFDWISQGLNALLKITFPYWLLWLSDSLELGRFHYCSFYFLFYFIFIGGHSRRM